MNPAACLVTISAISIALLMVLPSQGVYATRNLSEFPLQWYETKLPFVLSFNTTTGNDSAAIQFALYENDTGQAVSNVSYVVSIREAESNKDLMTDAFHTPDGRVFLRVIHDSEIDDLLIEGNREQFLNAWIANNATAPIVIRSAEMSLDRMYNIEIAILGAYNIRDLAPPDQIPKANIAWNPQDGNMATEVVVPEFSTVSLLVAAVSITSILIFRKLRWNT